VLGFLPVSGSLVRRIPRNERSNMRRWEIMDIISKANVRLRIGHTGIAKNNGYVLSTSSALCPRRRCLPFEPHLPYIIGRPLMGVYSKPQGKKRERTRAGLARQSHRHLK
jgi:hypothetical protein